MPHWHKLYLVNAVVIIVIDIFERIGIQTAFIFIISSQNATKFLEMI
jgi:hypothetical protein